MSVMLTFYVYSIQKNISEGVTALLIDFSGHCEDINSPPYQIAEPPAIPVARSQELEIISEWIEKYQRQKSAFINV